MELEDLVSKLMTQEELTTSRVGVMSTGREPIRLSAAGAEIVTLAPSMNGDALACELVLADECERSHSILPAALHRLCRDGICIATARKDFVTTAMRIIQETGPYWVAALDTDHERCFVISGIGVHPSELGSLVVDHLVCPAPAYCLPLPQNRDDRRRRRLVRRFGRSRLMALASGLRNRYGDAASRIVRAIELLVGERPPKPDSTGRNPDLLTLPDIEMEPWPDPERWSRLKEVMEICERYGKGVCKELRGFIASSSFSTYLADKYNQNKFQMDDPGRWRALRLIDWRKQTSALPSYCHETRQLLAELARQISGEVNILRVAPRSSLPPHYDSYDCEVYIQIGVTIPPGCGIRVGGKTRIWEEGRPVAFNPAFLHEVWNQSESPRDVLAIDTWHPDLTDIEIEGLQQVRKELEILRLERQKMEQAS